MTSGRDILSRLIFGARISLAVGLVVQAVILLIGVPAGLIAANFGGKIDTFIMRTVDALYSIPSLLFVIVIMTFLRATLATATGGFTLALATLDAQSGGLIGVFIGLGLINWMPAARLVRGQAVVAEREGVRRGSARPPAPLTHASLPIICYPTSYRSSSSRRRSASRRPSSTRPGSVSLAWARVLPCRAGA